MTERCVRCHHPLKYPTPSGMGRVCAKKAAAAIPQAVERDLFGYDIDRAVVAAQYQVRVLIEQLATEAHCAVFRSFLEARVRAGVVL